jgi:hypothetical protein
MPNEQISGNQPQPGAAPGLIARLWASITACVPIGYQDETGFHRGTEPLEPLSEAKPEKI